MLRPILISLLFILSCSSPADHSKLKVIEVTDGDTIRLSDGNLLRYIGLDTPEVRIKDKGRFIYSPQLFALEAKEYNRKLVENKLIEIEFDLEKKDRYGRLLGYCFVEGVFVNAKLIEEGYAVLYTHPPNIKYVDLFVSLQKKARKNKKGLWGSYEIIDHQAADKCIGQVRTVRGKVVDTYKSEKCTFLNFGRDYRKDFTIVIFNNSLAAFSQKNIDPVTFYRGKVVLVSGQIKEYNGPEIIVNSPYEIEVIE